MQRFLTGHYYKIQRFSLNKFVGFPLRKSSLKITKEQQILNMTTVRVNLLLTHSSFSRGAGGGFMWAEPVQVRGLSLYQ